MDIEAAWPESQRSSLKDLTDPYFNRCRAPNMQGPKEQTVLDSSLGQIWKQSKTILYKTQLGYFQGQSCAAAVQFGTSKSWMSPHQTDSSRMLPKISRPWISSHQMINWFQGTSKSWTSTNTFLTKAPRGAHTQLLQLTLMVHETCKNWNSQHLNRVAVSNFTTSLPGQPTTLSCPLENLWRKLVPCLW